MKLPFEGPITYAQWSDCLDDLVRGLDDEACLQRMRQGSLSWTGGVATLFSERLMKEFNRRLTVCSEHLSRDLRLMNEESAVVRAILNARQKLHFLFRLTRMPAFPDSLQTHLRDELRKFAVRSQNSLEDTGKADLSGRLTVLLRNNTLMRYEDLNTPGVTAPSKPMVNTGKCLVSSPTASSLGLRRRNILT